MSVEFDFVVTDSLEAMETYQKIFDVELIEVTDHKQGLNEAIFNMYGTRFHLLDENHTYNLIAPKKDDPKTMWVNIAVDNIEDVYSKAMSNGCTEIQKITQNLEFGVSSAIFIDPFHYVWMLHQKHN